MHREFPELRCEINYTVLINYRLLKVLIGIKKLLQMGTVKILLNLIRELLERQK